MANDRKGEFAVHCIMCGKNFYRDTEMTCGGSYSGKPMCKPNDIQRAMDERLVAATKGES